MIIASDRYQRELVASPSFARALLAEDDPGQSPVLLLKARMIILKYAYLLGFTLEIVTHRDGWIFYDVVIRDDPDNPATLWSVVEDPEELAALAAIVSGQRCHIGLFGELGTNVATATAEFSTEDARSGFPSNFKTRDKPNSPSHQQLLKIYDEARRSGATMNLLIKGSLNWKLLDAYHYLAGASSLLSFNDQNEGDQQERLAAWLTNGLSLGGVIQRPQVRLPSGPRELTDLLVRTEAGAVLIESKSLTVLGSAVLPPVSKLRSNIAHHVEKAARQLSGAIRSIRKGYELTSADGVRVEVDQLAIGQALILIPDLSLLQGATHLGGEFLIRLARETGYVFQIIDPADLLRVVQAATTFARKTNLEVTESLAFDNFLFERSQYAVASASPALGVLFK